MLKKAVKHYMLVLVLILASVFCIFGFKCDKTGIDSVSAQQVFSNETVDLEVQTQSGFVKGVVSGYGSYPVGSEVNLIATPSVGCKLVKWQIWDDATTQYIDVTDTNGSLIISNPYSFVISENTKIQAVFEYVTYKVNNQFPEYFKLSEIKFDYDANRFTQEDLAEYPRPQTDLTVGAFYYGDIASLSFDIEETYLKEVASNNFVLNKRAMLIAVDESGNILYTETNGTKSTLVAGIPISSYEDYKYEEFDYVVATNKLEEDKYITTKVEVKALITSDLNLRLTNQTELQVLKLSSVLTNGIELDINSVLDCIQFNYGYYAKISGSDSQKLYYLIEEGANFKFTLSNNLIYSYQYAVGSKTYDQNPIQDYFNSTSELVFYFEKISYQITFKQILNNGVSVDADWLKFPNLALYPGEKLIATFDATNKNVKHFDGEGNIITSEDIEENAVFGFKFVGFNTSDFIDISLGNDYSQIELSMDLASPSEAIIYVILEEIKYSFNFGVADSEGDYSEFFTSKFRNLPESGLYTRGDNILLTADIPAGYNKIGWIMECGGISYDIEFSNFTFYPTTNDVFESNIYLKVEYVTYGLTLSLNGFDTNGDNVAEIGLNIIKYFTISSDKETLTIHGNYYNHDTLDGILEETATKHSISSDQRTITYNSALGNIVVYFEADKTTPNSLTFNSYTFTYKEIRSGVYRFTRNTDEARVAVASSQVNSSSNGRAYTISLSNLCVDDIIYANSQLVNENYKFNYYLKAGTNSELSKIKASSFNEKDNVYLCQLRYLEDTTVIVTYGERSKVIDLKTSNEFAYALRDLGCELNGTGSIQYTSGDLVKKVSVESGSIDLIVTHNKMTAGYRFVGFYIEFINNPNGKQSEYLLGNSSISVNADAYVLNLAIDGDYEGSTIIANFEELEYIVNFDTTADINAYNDQNTNIMQEKSIVLSWSSLAFNPTINVRSRYGYYINNAYYFEEDDVNRINTLLGDKDSQTDATYVFDAEKFENYVIKLSDANNSVTIYLTEAEREFSLTLIYSMPEEQEDYAQYASGAIAKCTIEDVTRESSAQYGLIGSEYVYYVTFESILHGSTMTLTIDDSTIEGLYFASWQIDYNYYTDNPFETELNGDMKILVNFSIINYSLKYTILNNELESDCGKALTFVNGIKNNSFKIGDKIQIDISEAAGYSFDKMCYKKGNVQYEGDGITFLSQNLDGYTYIIEQFIPSNFLASTRDEQKQNGTFNLHLVFKEKLFTISVTPQSASQDNTTGISIGEWIDKDELEILFFDGQDYTTKSADPDGKVYFNTNSKIQIRFNSSFLGIKFTKLILGPSTINSTGIHNELGQEIRFLNDEDKGSNYYVLEFELTSEVLENIGTDINFDVLVYYKINTYKITFCTNSIDSKLLGEQYKVTVSIQIPPQPKSSGEGKISLRSVAYGPQLIFNVNSENSTGEFNQKYWFSCFYYEKNGIKISFNVQEYKNNATTLTAFTLDTTEVLTDRDGTQYNFWELIAEDSKPTIYAYYEPKISLGEGFEYCEEHSGYEKNVVYNGKVQLLTYSADGVLNPDIIYPTELGGITITYTLGGGATTNPKDVNTYIVSIKVGSTDFSGKVLFVINKAKLEFHYSGAPIIKEYDGDVSLTGENLLTLKNGFSLTGLMENDASDIVLDWINGTYSSYQVGTKYDVTISGLRLGESLKRNYYVDDQAGESYTIARLGTINKKQLTINRDSFIFNNIVYKEGQDYVLKHNISEYLDGTKTLTFRETLPYEKNDECYIDINLLSASLNDYSIGENRAVVLNLSDALDGADKDNYYINDITYYINIYPYQLVYEIENYGRFTITDIDELCVIPIDTSLKDFSVEIINSGNAKYPDIYGMIENIISRTEKVHSFYQFTIKTTKGNVRDVKDFKNAYITFSEVKNLTSVYNISEEIDKVSTSKQNNDIVIKIQDETSNTIGVFVNKSYLAIWRIVLIVGLLLLLLAIIIIVIIIYKKKIAGKRDDKIY